MTRTVERMLPLYEGKMIHHFDHRWATYDSLAGEGRGVTALEKCNPDFVVQPRYWVRQAVVADRLLGRWQEPWILGWRDICRVTDARTMIASQLPTVGVGHTLPVVVSVRSVGALQALWSSFVFDFAARQKLGGTHMTYSYLKQLVICPPNATLPWGEDAVPWLEDRANLLQSASSWFNVDRPALRAEIDAACFHLFGIERDDVDYIMETFPIVKQGDLAEHAYYRTKDLILDVYDQMQRAIDTGEPYVSPLQSLLDEMRLVDD